MPGIPVRTVSKGGLPVVSVARGKGIPVTESDRGIPVTIAANGFGLPVYFESAAPPIDFDFQEFNMTAGQEGQWIGFSTGAPTTPQPAFGSISGQPTAVTNLLAFYDDTASGVFLAVFSGDYVDELQGLELAIGGFVVDSFEVQLISGNTWVRFTGIPGDLTPGSVYEVEFGWDLTPPVQMPWTLADIPSEYRTNGGLWEADNATIVNTNQVSAVTDTWGVRDMVQATSANQPFFGQRSGFNAIVWPDTVGTRRLSPASALAPVYWAFVMSYNTGDLATFNGSPTIIGNGSVNRVMGLSAAATLWQNVASSWTQQMSKNAGPYSATVLPMPMSVAEIKGPAISTTWALGGTQSNGAWQGPIFLAMALGIEPTGDLLARIQGFLAWKYGLQEQLPAGHPYKNAAPTKDFSVQQQGNNFTFEYAPTDQEFDVTQSGNEFAFTGA